jgi:hypothetical protein
MASAGDLPTCDLSNTSGHLTSVAFELKRIPPLLTSPKLILKGSWLAAGCCFRARHPNLSTFGQSTIRTKFSDFPRQCGQRKWIVLVFLCVSGVAPWRLSRPRCDIPINVRKSRGRSSARSTGSLNFCVAL